MLKRVKRMLINNNFTLYYMRSTLIILFVFFNLYTNAQTNSDTINWRKDYKLKWEDFKGVPDDISSIKAVSSIGINYTLSYNTKTFSYAITCAFRKKESWTKSTDSTLLEHENTHFGIAQYFAKKLNLLFKSYKFCPTTIQNDFKKIALMIKEERRKMDTQYDNENKTEENVGIRKYIVKEFPYPAFDQQVKRSQYRKQ